MGAHISGSFYLQRLSYLMVNAIPGRLWGVDRLTDVLSSSDGFFFFKCKSKDAIEKILEEGPWHMVNWPFSLRRWQPNLSILSKDLKKLPSWVKLLRVPLEYWTDDGLSILASGIGKLLFVDHRTMEKSRVEFARLCVEVQAANEMVRGVSVVDPDGNEFVVQVEYDWDPLVIRRPSWLNRLCSTHHNRWSG